MEQSQEYKTQIVYHGQLISFATNFDKKGKNLRTLGYMKGRKVELNKIWDKISENHVAILLRKTPEDKELTYFKDNIYEQMEEVFCDYIGKINDALEEFKNAADAIAAELKDHTSQGNHRPSISIKLPQIPLPTFNGKYTEWAYFRDMFRSMIVYKEELTSVQKMQYLMMSLSGEAKALVQHYDIAAANFTTVWDCLCGHYDNKRILVHHQLRKFFQQPNINNESATGIRHLIDVTNECLSGLRGLGVSVDTWDPILIFQLGQRLPQETRQLWEQSLGASTTVPTYTQLKDFLEARYRTLEALSACKPRYNQELNSDRKPTHSSGNQSFTQSYHSGTSQKGSCPNCKGPHLLRECPEFLKMSISSRQEIVRKKGICFNCLAQSHMRSRCSSRGSCQKCGKRHNSLLHDSERYDKTASAKASPTQAQGYSLTVAPTSSVTSSSQSQESTSSNVNQTPTQPQNVVVHHVRNENHTLLATALVKATANAPCAHSLRALVDPGSQASFITENAAQLLQAETLSTSVTVTGLGGITTGTSHAMVKILISSLYTPEKIELNAITMKSLTRLLPSQRLSTALFMEFHDLKLADPFCHKPGSIDLILGADVYPKILESGIKTSSDGNLVAQQTKLGWILSGKCPNVPDSPVVFSFFNFLELETQLKQFWELEEVVTTRPLSKEDTICEKIFCETVSRQPDGRYEVHLPFRDNQSPLGQSRKIAMSRYLSQERRLGKDPELRQDYNEVLQEYLVLGHMEEVPSEDLDVPHYYLPHHAVIKEHSLTTKLRVVFNASCKTSSHQSLNDILYVGPKLQNDICSLILRWRKKEYVFTADIEKMYRQIWMTGDHRNFQRILWRPKEDSPIKDYHLSTVTFGVNCAPYLAIRTLNKLAEDEGNRYPCGSTILLNDVYVDDVLSGATTLEETRDAMEQVNQILRLGGFRLRKWASNKADLLKHIPAEDRLIEVPLNLGKDNTIKTLGIRWDPLSDNLYFKGINLFDDKPPTKRTVLSEIAQLYDPLGWVAPLIVIAKIFMQRLWLAGLDWDSRLPEGLMEEWTRYKKDLSELPVLQIPRWIHHGKDTRAVQLHGFSDASERAYGAVVYLRVVDFAEQVHVHLLAAKSRVAPVKAVSLPRLELCGAVLLAALIKKVKHDMDLDDVEFYAWTDSTIVLTWIHDHSSRWKPFVANRVTDIQNYVGPKVWRHVPTKDNPADHASRGISAQDLLNCGQWWTGPEWLKEPKENWPNRQPPLHSVEKDLEIRRERPLLSCLHTAKEASLFNMCEYLIAKVSALHRLVRITAYILRFLNNSMPSKGKPRYTGPLSVEELFLARLHLLRYVQGIAFLYELGNLKDKKEVSAKSKLKSLNPFLDTNGILRVGGRLELSSLPYSKKHPIILPSNSSFTHLVVQQAHLDTLHGTTSLTLQQVRQEYWIVRARNLVKYQIQRCIKCFRLRKETGQQMMGQLPAERTLTNRPFTNVGVDYAGPILIRMSKGRGVRCYKGYIVIFVCFSTKAIHLEVASDLSTETFLAAFRRFVARRGLCNTIFSDCGTNFVGANNTLQKDLAEFMASTSKEVAELIAKDGVKWRFIPPGSPHFGGLWEAGVKSMKHHLRCVLGNATVTYEELTTITAQIEACLNSRPLTSITDDPEDLEALTPGHFLIGTALLSPPEENLLDRKEGRLQRWNYIQKLRQHFWQRWTSEYLCRLQQRNKWKTSRPNPDLGDLVILKDERLPPLKWPLGRIIELHPGKDSFVRVVTVKTANATLQRPISKICILPKDTEPKDKSENN